MKKTLNIATITSQVDPYSKTGGLADVARSLPKAFQSLGHKNIVITPFYGMIIDAEKYNLEQFASNVEIHIDKNNTEQVNFWRTTKETGAVIYFVENKKYFSKRKEIYGSNHENARFLLFDLAAIKLLHLLEYSADVIQCHDWQSGLVPYFIKKRYAEDPLFKNALTVFTIHNLVFQLGKNWWEIPTEDRDAGRNGLPDFQDDKIENVNFAKRAIVNANIITAVSEQYAVEILTKNFGEDLHRILKNREHKIFGIVNGIDYNDYNPEIDPGLKQRYGINNIQKKVINKLYLQEKFGLPQNKEIPLIGIVSRITEQKGFDLIMEVIDAVMRLDVQVVIKGGGEKKYEQFFNKMRKKYPDKIGVDLQFTSSDVTQIYAGSDMFLMPSRFEPCGLGQLISLRYGSVPIVREVGGLADTVNDFNPKTGRGNGFEFNKYDAHDLLIAVTRAVETYKHKEIWNTLLHKAMTQSFSWEIPAKKYIKLFKKILKEKILSS